MYCIPNVLKAESQRSQFNPVQIVNHIHGRFIPSCCEFIASEPPPSYLHAKLCSHETKSALKLSNTIAPANPGHQSDARQMREQREKRGAGDAQSGPRVMWKIDFPCTEGHTAGERAKERH